ncbi:MULTISPECIES: peptidylprolyl isomerase [Hyphobacterium]|uniref:Parvulin-like PPIase n=1 Tax=Hyphobacterium vulgare TaxID=1736751 RepID=A0ABV6ZT04_9PROT
MLSAIRALARNPIALALILGPLILGFMIFGVSDVFVQSGSSVATVQNQRVSAMDFSEAWEFRLREVQQEQPTLTSDQARELGLADAVLNQLVIQAQLRAVSDNMGLGVSARQVANEIAGYGAFIDPVTGRFDQDSYRQFLAEQRMTETRFEDNVQRDLLSRQLIDALFAGIDVPDAFAQQLYQYSYEERVIRGLVIPPEAAGDIDDPTDEQLQSVIDDTLNDDTPANDLFFQNPERRSFTLVRFRVDDFTRDVEVSDEDIRAQYDYEVEGGELGEPALRSYVQIRVDDEETAVAVAERLAAGEDPDSVAEAVGGDTPFAETERQSYQIPDDALADALFSMETGEARAVEGAFGWFAVSVTDGREATIPTFEERESEIRQLLARAEAEDAMYEAMGQFEEARGGGATLEEASLLAETFYEAFQPITRNARNSEGYPAGTLLDENDQAAQYFSFFLDTETQPEILESVFDQLAGYATELQPYGDGDYFAVRVDEVLPAEILPLDEVREDAEALWRIQSVDERLTALAETALDRARAGESLDAIAADIPGARVETTTVTRGESAAPFGRETIGVAFQIDPGTFEHAGAVDRRSHIILTVDEVIAPETVVDADLAALTEQSDTRYSQDIDAAFVSALSERYPATINPTLRDQVLGVNAPNASR